MQNISPIKIKLKRYFFYTNIFFICVLFGCASNFLVKHRYSNENDLNIKSIARNDSIFAILGGYRSIVADFVWINMMNDFLASNENKVLSKINEALLIDPNREYFWIQGANIIAYDLPAWKIIENGGYKQLSTQKQNQFYSKYALIAVNILEKSPFTNTLNISLLKSNLYFNRLADIPKAMQTYKYMADKFKMPVAFEGYAKCLALLGYKQRAKEFINQALLIENFSPQIRQDLIMLEKNL